MKILDLMGYDTMMCRDPEFVILGHKLRAACPTLFNNFSESIPFMHKCWHLLSGAFSDSQNQEAVICPQFVQSGPTPFRVKHFNTLLAAAKAKRVKRDELRASGLRQESAATLESTSTGLGVGAGVRAGAEAGAVAAGAGAGAGEQGAASVADSADDTAGVDIAEDDLVEAEAAVADYVDGHLRVHDDGAMDDSDEKAELGDGESAAPASLHVVSCSLV